MVDVERELAMKCAREWRHSLWCNCDPSGTSIRVERVRINPDGSRVTTYHLDRVTFLELETSGARRMSCLGYHQLLNGEWVR